MLLGRNFESNHSYDEGDLSRRRGIYSVLEYSFSKIEPHELVWGELQLDTIVGADFVR